MRHYIQDKIDVIKLVAMEAIPKNRLVVQDVSEGIKLFDPENVNHYNMVVGISDEAYSTGNRVNVVRYGDIETELLLVAGSDVYGNPSGVLASAPPVTGIIQPVGLVTESGKISINIGTPSIRVSSGSANANMIVSLGGSGRIDSSMLDRVKVASGTNTINALTTTVVHTRTRAAGTTPYFSIFCNNNVANLSFGAEADGDIDAYFIRTTTPNEYSLRITNSDVASKSVDWAIFEDK